MIIGRDLLQALMVVINFEYQVIKWDDVSISMNRMRLSKNNRKGLHSIFPLAKQLEIYLMAPCGSFKIVGRILT